MGVPPGVGSRHSLGPRQAGSPPPRRSLCPVTIRPIRILGDPVLRTPTPPVTSFDAELAAVVRDLLDTLRGEPGRAGVAAPQIGVAARVFVYGAGGVVGHLVNPRITARDGV